MPVRNGKQLAPADGKRTASNKSNKKPVLPLLVLDIAEEAEFVVFGRRQLLPCLFSACGCSLNAKSTRFKCTLCQQVNQWAVPCLSRDCFCFSWQSKTLWLQVRMKMASWVFLNDRAWAPHTQHCYCCCPASEWTKPRAIASDTITRITVVPPPYLEQPSCWLEFDVFWAQRGDARDGEGGLVCKEMSLPRSPGLGAESNRIDEMAIAETAGKKDDNDKAYSNATKPNTGAARAIVVRGYPASNDPKLKSKLRIANNTNALDLSYQGLERGNNDPKPGEFVRPSPESDTRGTTSPTHPVRNDSPQQPQTANNSNARAPPVLEPASTRLPASRSAVSADVTNDDTERAGNTVRTSCKAFPHAATACAGDMSTLSPALKEPDRQCAIYFVKLGHDLTSQMIEILSNKVRRFGARVVTRLREDNPTHMIVSQYVSDRALAKELKFADEEQLAHFIYERDIHMAVPAWIVKSRNRLKDITLEDTWVYIWPKRRRGEAGPRSPRGKAKKRRHDDSSYDNRSGTAFCDRNAELSELFQRLSKLHQTAPLLDVDEWKAYCFNLIAGRLRQLPFQITDDPGVKQKVRSIRGIGASTMEKIEEYLRTGKIRRIEEFERDPKRIAMKNMMGIWGVGRAKASELVNKGFENIDQVRQAVNSRMIQLDRNQLIGCECYEEILEKMDRSEVEAIGKIVINAVHARFPNAEATIMGSYRRGKELCGDVDILVVCKDYMETVPRRVLASIVGDLSNDGRIAFHLTNLLPGMTTYFGVFHSPSGKRRRVDIKFYPYRERAFASLYFTGNGHFNRSMRLWATRKFKLTLSDHGLFFRDTTKRVLETGSEKEVFDYLRLVYKEPKERDCFDAVVGKNQAEGLQMTKADFFNDSKHIWVD